MATEKRADQRTVDIVAGFIKRLSNSECDAKIMDLCIAFYFTPLFEARIINDTDYKSSNIRFEVMDDQCLLIRNALTMGEQIELFTDIQHRDKSPKTAMKAMYPSPKTYIFGEDAPTLIFKFEDGTMYNRLVNKANAIMARNQLLLDTDLKEYSSITMGAIKYPSPNGHFAAHIDHDDSFVYLMSIGCTANFMVKGPGMSEKKVIKFKSGDLLCFNASTHASILHEVVNIDDPSTCPDVLDQKFKVLKTHRVGVQCRVRC